MSDLTADSGKLQLMAEIERLDKQNAAFSDTICERDAEIERLRITEIRLRAHIKELKSMDDNDGDEVERLKAALREIADGNGNVDAILVARAALEGKP